MISLSDWLNSKRGEECKEELEDWLDNMPSCVNSTDICLFDRGEWISARLEEAYLSEISDYEDRCYEEYKDARFEDSRES